MAASSSTYPDHLSGSFLGIMPIERGKVREYAAATGAARPVYLDDPAPPIPPTFLSSVVLWAQIGESTRDERVLGAAAIAAPVWGHDKRSYCLTVTGPSARFDGREKPLRELIVEGAAHLSNLFGASQERAG